MLNHTKKNKQQLISELQQALQRNAELQDEVRKNKGVPFRLLESQLQQMMNSLPHAIFLINKQDYLLQIAKNSDN